MQYYNQNPIKIPFKCKTCNVVYKYGGGLHTHFDKNHKNEKKPNRYKPSGSPRKMFLNEKNELFYIFNLEKPYQFTEDEYVQWYEDINNDIQQSYNLTEQQFKQVQQQSYKLTRIFYFISSYQQAQFISIHYLSAFINYCFEIKPIENLKKEIYDKLLILISTYCQDIKAQILQAKKYQHYQIEEDSSTKNIFNDNQNQIDNQKQQEDSQLPSYDDQQNCYNFPQYQAQDEIYEQSDDYQTQTSNIQHQFDNLEIQDDQNTNNNQIIEQNNQLNAGLAFQYSSQNIFDTNTSFNLTINPYEINEIDNQYKQQQKYQESSFSDGNQFNQVDSQNSIIPQISSSQRLNFNSDYQEDYECISTVLSSFYPYFQQKQQSPKESILFIQPNEYEIHHFPQIQYGDNYQYNSSI